MDKTITSFQMQGRRSPKIIVALDGAVWATLDPETVVRERLHTGQVLAEPRRAEILATDEAIRARKAAAAHTAHTPKTQRELDQHLRQRKFSEPARRSALETLAQSGTVDDERVTEWFIRNRRRRRDMGPLRLEAELRARGIPSPIAAERVHEALAGADLAAECLALARRSAKRFEPLTEATQRRKLATFLQRRGYESEWVRAALGALRAAREGSWEEDDEA